MESLNSLIRDPAYHDILAIVKGARNGLVYGAKVRFPHALIMTLLFHGGRPWKTRAHFVYSATKQHALNLCKFVSIYKTALLLQRRLGGGKERKADAFFAGLIGGWIVFGERNAINEQIVLYILSRVVTSFLPRAASTSKPGAGGPITSTPAATAAAAAPARPLPGADVMPMPPGYPYPRPQPLDEKVFELYAALAWGMVMYVFRWRRETLQGGLVNSMQYLYLDSEVWTNIKNLLWFNKT